MSQPLLLKIYGDLRPVDDDLAKRIRRVSRKAIPSENICVELDNGLLTIAFEGIFYPLEEMLAIIEKNMSPDTCGKLDVLDIENWCMTRRVFNYGGITSKTSPLNNVLDYSGF